MNRGQPAAPVDAHSAISPDVLLSRVEPTFLRPHSWSSHYADRFGSFAEFVSAHRDTFDVTSDGRVYRRGAQAPPVQMVMMVTPLPPHVRGPQTEEHTSSASSPSLTAVAPSEASAVADFGPSRPKHGRGGGYTGGRGPRRGGGAGRAPTHLF